MIVFEPSRVSMSMLEAMQQIVAKCHVAVATNVSPLLREIILYNVYVTTLANFYVVYVAQQVVRFTDKVSELYKQREPRAGGSSVPENLQRQGPPG
jgi:hypothetical protein